MNVNSIVEGKWREVVNVALSEEQKQLLESRNPADNEARSALIQSLQDSTMKEITDESVILSLNAEYVKLKPTVSESDAYQLISVDMSLNEDNKVISSILNCRINGEHKQVRG